LFNPETRPSDEISPIWVESTEIDIQMSAVRVEESDLLKHSRL